MKYENWQRRQGGHATCLRVAVLTGPPPRSISHTQSAHHRARIYGAWVCIWPPPSAASPQIEGESLSRPGRCKLHRLTQSKLALGSATPVNTAWCLCVKWAALQPPVMIKECSVCWIVCVLTPAKKNQYVYVIHTYIYFLICQVLYSISYSLSEPCGDKNITFFFDGETLHTSQVWYEMCGQQKLHTALMQM